MRVADKVAQQVLYEVTGAVAVVTFNRPECLNALTAPMVDRYLDLLRLADADPEVRAIVVSGAGRGFSSGADLRVVAGDPDRAADLIRATEPGPALTAALSKPLVVAIHGPAIGLGLALTLGADVRVVADDARLCLPFSRLGAIAEYASAWYLPRLVGTGNALDILCSGRFFSGEDAYRMGLAQVCVPADRVLETALDYALALVSDCSPAAMRSIRAMVWGSADETLGDHFTASVPTMLSTPRTVDFREAMTARRENRAVAFPPLADRPDVGRPPTAAERIQVVRRCVEAWNTRDVEAILACYSPEVVYSDPGTGGEIRGHDALRRYLQACFAAWEQIVITLRETHATEGRGVVALWDVTMRPWNSGTAVTVPGIDFLEINTDHTISRDEAVSDRLPLTSFRGAERTVADAGHPRRS